MEAATLDRPRFRERVSALRFFETGCISDAERDLPWVDRARFTLNGIGLRWGSGDPYSYLRERQEIGRFRHERQPGGVHVLSFKPNRWLFQAKLKLWPIRGRQNTRGLFSPAYTGRADITINPTRFFAHLAPENGGGSVPAFRGDDLIPGRNTALSQLTLNGSDNMVPDSLIPAALNTDWPHFVQAYANAVAAQITSAIGTAYDVEAERGCDYQPLLILPASSDWSLRQIEQYHEYQCADAIKTVSEIEPHAWSLSREMQSRRYEPVIRTEVARSHNAKSLTMSLGVQGTNLAIYAKSADRLRTEIRYQKKPLAVCGLTASDFQSEPNGLALLVQATGRDATKRLRIWFADYSRTRTRQEPNLGALLMLVSGVVAACNHDMVLVMRVLRMLLEHSGLSPSEARDTPLDEVINYMYDRTLLTKVRSTKSNKGRLNFKLRADLASVVQSLKSWEQNPGEGLKLMSGLL